MATANQKNLVEGVAENTAVKTAVASNNNDARRLLLEKYLKGEIRKSEAPAPIPRRPADVLPQLSFAQQQVWLHAQLAPTVPIYNEPMTITRTGPLDLAVVERCMVEIIRRHEIWRTTFDTVDGQPVQIVHPAPASFSLPQIDLRRLPEVDRQAEALRLVSEEGARLFDMKRGPLVRALVLRLQDERYDLFFNIHQIILDGATAYRGLFRELVALYDAFSQSQPSPLSEPVIQYADYAVWHRDWVRNGKEIPQQMAYWEEKLAGDLPILQWPNDRPRPAAQTFSGKVSSLMMPKSFVRALSEFSQREGVTLYMTLLAGFAVLMNRYTSQEDVIVGTVSANRKRPETESMLGYFLNPLPLRTDASGDPKFRELLARVRQVVSGALSNDDVPFEQLVKQFHKGRDLSRNPLFQVVVSLEPAMPSLGPGWDMVLGATPTGASKLDLYINFDERRDGLMAAITYNPDLFEDETIARMVAHWQTVLEAAVANPDTRISQLPLLTEPERHQLLVEWNATEQEYSQACIHELFEAQAAKTPDATALIFSATQLTYGQLNQRANQMAHYLKRNGVASGQRVAVCMERSLDTVIGLLGILKAGAAYVPVDPAYPMDRVRMMIEDSQPSVILTQAKHLAKLPENTARVVWAGADGDATEIGKESRENPASHVTPDDVAYIIYTSGSSGKPKGVMGTHRGAVNRFDWMWQTYPFAADEVCCQKTSLSFVDSIWEIFGPTLAGVKSVIVSDEIVKDPPRFVDFLAAQHVTRIVLVPSLLRTMLEIFPNLQSRLPRLKYWVTSGEALGVELAQRFTAAVPDAALINLYGSSEVAADSTFYRVEKDTKVSSIPIGRPIANTQVYILDENLQPVPVRVPGELYVGGDGLARGYFNRPELTTEKFVVDPFRESTNARLYKTGDLARYLPDGNIEYLGRGDSQVKIRGFRIELGEIEAVLNDRPGVKQSVVAAWDDHTGAKRLVAYLVTAEGQLLKQIELHSYLRQRLPEYMVPSIFIPLDSLPLLPNGKVNRRALPSPEASAPIASSEVVAPANSLQRQLLVIWQEVLGTQNIGVRNDFFELGGHSLLIPALLLRVERAFGKRLSPAAIFQAPTIEKLAEMIERQSAQLVQVMPIQPAGSKPPFFCICLAAGPLLRELALELGDDQPFLGLGFNPAELEQLATPYTLEDICAHLVRAIREQQPEGPYFLGGFCLNGLIAFETARQLTAQGERVALLALFEAVNPAHRDSFSQRSQLATLVSRFSFGLVKNHLTSMAGLGAGGAKQYFLTRFTDIKRDVKNLFWSSYVDLKRRVGDGRLPQLQEILYVAARSYYPVPYAGSVAFYRCTDRRANSSSELERGWTNLLPADFELHVLEGDHMGILVGKSLKVLASKLTDSLAKASQDAESGAKTSSAVVENAALVADPFCGIRS
jgi:amino acid adenylation domain-containing protein